MDETSAYKLVTANTEDTINQFKEQYDKAASPVGKLLAQACAFAAYQSWWLLCQSQLTIEDDHRLQKLTLFL
jgi:hypothetical protein